MDHQWPVNRRQRRPDRSGQRKALATTAGRRWVSCVWGRASSAGTRRYGATPEGFLAFVREQLQAVRRPQCAPTVRATAARGGGGLDRRSTPRSTRGDPLGGGPDNRRPAAMCGGAPRPRGLGTTAAVADPRGERGRVARKRPPSRRAGHHGRRGERRRSGRALRVALSERPTLDRIVRKIAKHRMRFRAILRDFGRF